MTESSITTPFADHQSRRVIRTGQRRREGQLLLQHGAHLLVCLQSPPFSHRTAPMLIPGILAVPDLYLYPTHHCPQTHRLFSPMMHLPAAEGEKLRLGGWLRPGAFAPAVGASIRALLPKLPALSRAESAADCSPRSLVLSYSNGLFSRKRNHLRPRHYGGCVKMRPLLPRL